MSDGNEKELLNCLIDLIQDLGEVHVSLAGQQAAARVVMSDLRAVLNIMKKAYQPPGSLPARTKPWTMSEGKFRHLAAVEAHPEATDTASLRSLEQPVRRPSARVSFSLPNDDKEGANSHPSARPKAASDYVPSSTENQPPTASGQSDSQISLHASVDDSSSNGTNAAGAGAVGTTATSVNANTRTATAGSSTLPSTSRLTRPTSLSASRLRPPVRPGGASATAPTSATKQTAAGTSAAGKAAGAAAAAASHSTSSSRIVIPRMPKVVLRNSGAAAAITPSSFAGGAPSSVVSGTSTMTAGGAASGSAASRMGSGSGSGSGLGVSNADRANAAIALAATARSFSEVSANCEEEKVRDRRSSVGGFDSNAPPPIPTSIGGGGSGTMASPGMYDVGWASSSGSQATSRLPLQSLNGSGATTTATAHPTSAGGSAFEGTERAYEHYVNQVMQLRSLWRGRRALEEAGDELMLVQQRVMKWWPVAGVDADLSAEASAVPTSLSSVRYPERIRTGEAFMHSLYDIYGDDDDDDDDSSSRPSSQAASRTNAPPLGAYDRSSSRTAAQSYYKGSSNSSKYGNSKDGGSYNNSNSSTSYHSDSTRVASSSSSRRSNSSLSVSGASSSVSGASLPSFLSRGCEQVSGRRGRKRPPCSATESKVAFGSVVAGQTWILHLLTQQLARTRKFPSPAAALEDAATSKEWRSVLKLLRDLWRAKEDLGNLVEALKSSVSDTLGKESSAGNTDDEDDNDDEDDEVSLLGVSRAREGRSDEGSEEDTGDQNEWGDRRKEDRRKEGKQKEGEEGEDEDADEAEMVALWRNRFLRKCAPLAFDALAGSSRAFVSFGSVSELARTSSLAEFVINGAGLFGGGGVRRAGREVNNNRSSYNHASSYDSTRSNGSRYDGGEGRSRTRAERKRRGRRSVEAPLGLWLPSDKWAPAVDVAAFQRLGLPPWFSALPMGCSVVAAAAKEASWSSSASHLDQASVSLARDMISNGTPLMPIPSSLCAWSPQVTVSASAVSKLMSAFRPAAVSELVSRLALTAGDRVNVQAASGSSGVSEAATSSAERVAERVAAAMLAALDKTDSTNRVVGVGVLAVPSRKAAAVYGGERHSLANALKRTRAISHLQTYLLQLHLEKRAGSGIIPNPDALNDILRKLAARGGPRRSGYQTPDPKSDVMFLRRLAIERYLAQCRLARDLVPKDGRRQGRHFSLSIVELPATDVEENEFRAASTTSKLGDASAAAAYGRDGYRKCDGQSSVRHRGGFEYGHGESEEKGHGHGNDGQQHLDKGAKKKYGSGPQRFDGTAVRNDDGGRTARTDGNPPPVVSSSSSFDGYYRDNELDSDDHDYDSVYERYNNNNNKTDHSSNHNGHNRNDNDHGDVGFGVQTASLYGRREMGSRDSWGAEDPERSLSRAFYNSN